MPAASAAKVDPNKAVSLSRTSVDVRSNSSRTSAARAAAGPKRRWSYAYRSPACAVEIGEKRGVRCQATKP